MAENDTTPQKRPKKKRRPSNTIFYFLIFAGVIGSFFLYFLYLEQSSAPVPAADHQEQTTAPEKTPADEPLNSTDQDAGAGPVHVDPLPQNNSLADEPVSEQENTSRGQESPDASPENTTGERNCKSSLTSIEDFYLHLDQQEYLKPYQLGMPSDVYFSSLIQKVVDNPPIVTGETDDLFSILKNTAHFFRIVGKKNIFVLKAILDREKDSFENVLAEFYQLTSRPECLQEGFSLNISQDALYDYAGFFLNTMGGRLYLFRRDSVSRMAVSYYSILIVDNANQNGTNKHGIDIVPAINTLIPELENSGSQLRLKDQYLDSLYDLKEKYM